jgi:hypothetical protein
MSGLSTGYTKSVKIALDSLWQSLAAFGEPHDRSERTNRLAIIQALMAGGW